MRTNNKKYYDIIKKIEKKHGDIFSQLNELYEQSHGGCDDTTCSMSHAMASGQSILAYYLLSSSGAANEEFYELIEKISNKEMYYLWQHECKYFNKEVPSMECKHGCGAYIYNPEDAGYHCSNCGESSE